MLSDTISRQEACQIFREMSEIGILQRKRGQLIHRQDFGLALEFHGDGVAGDFEDADAMHGFAFFTGFAVEHNGRVGG